MNDQDSSVAGESLDLIPRAVRDKLDRVGVKLHLKEWQALSVCDRERLLTAPCETADEATRYTTEIDRLVTATSGRAAERVRH